MLSYSLRLYDKFVSEKLSKRLKLCKCWVSPSAETPNLSWSSHSLFVDCPTESFPNCLFRQLLLAAAGTFATSITALNYLCYYSPSTLSLSLCRFSNWVVPNCSFLWYVCNVLLANFTTFSTCTSSTTAKLLVLLLLLLIIFSLSLFVDCPTESQFPTFHFFSKSARRIILRSRTVPWIMLTFTIAD